MMADTTTSSEEPYTSEWSQPSSSCLESSSDSTSASGHLPSTPAKSRQTKSSRGFVTSDADIELQTEDNIVVIVEEETHWKRRKCYICKRRSRPICFLECNHRVCIPCCRSRIKENERLTSIYPCARGGFQKFDRAYPLDSVLEFLDFWHYNGHLLRPLGIRKVFGINGRKWSFPFFLSQLFVVLIMCHVIAWESSQDFARSIHESDHLLCSDLDKLKSLTQVATMCIFYGSSIVVTCITLLPVTLTRSMMMSGAFLGYIVFLRGLTVVYATLVAVWWGFKTYTCYSTNSLVIGAVFWTLLILVMVHDIITCSTRPRVPLHLPTLVLDIRSDFIALTWCKRAWCSKREKTATATTNRDFFVGVGMFASVGNCMTGLFGASMVGIPIDVVLAVTLVVNVPILVLVMLIGWKRQGSWAYVIFLGPVVMTLLLYPFVHFTLYMSQSTSIDEPTMALKLLIVRNVLHFTMLLGVSHIVYRLRSTGPITVE